MGGCWFRVGSDIRRLVMSEKEMKTFVIMRGVPGSGKSYQAKRIMAARGGHFQHIFSTDNYFIPFTVALRRDGDTVTAAEELEEYRSNWQSWKLGTAHAENYRLFKEAVDAGVEVVVLDNTNIYAKHIQPYAKYAFAAGYEVEIHEPTSDWWTAHCHYLQDKCKYAAEIAQFAEMLHARQTHGVPLQTITKMLLEWEHVTIKDLV